MAFPTQVPSGVMNRPTAPAYGGATKPPMGRLATPTARPAAMMAMMKKRIGK